MTTLARIWTDAAELARDVEAFRVERVRYTGKTPTVVSTSGGFDPLHVGHLRCIQDAADLGDRLVVVVNGDGFLLRKKGFAFMPLEERLRIVAAVRGVTDVLSWDDGTQTVAGVLEIVRPDFFAKGGDRSTPASIVPEEREVCRRIGCMILHGIGGTEKVRSSSELVARFRERIPCPTA